MHLPEPEHRPLLLPPHRRIPALNRLLSALTVFLPAPSGGNRREHLRACVGAAIGLALTGLVAWRTLPHGTGQLWFAAPMGASAVLLFAVPASPLAQPWSMLGGNLVATVTGLLVAATVSGWPPYATGALAAAIALALMFGLRCVHPPSGALALMTGLGGPALQAQGWHVLWRPIGLNSLVLVLVALVYNNLTGRRYPHRQRPAYPPQPTAGTGGAGDSAQWSGGEATLLRVGFEPGDLDRVLARYNQVLDVSRDDLEAIMAETGQLAYERRFGQVSCGDAMRSGVAVDFGTPLDEAWRLLRDARVGALPVIDRAGRVTGMLGLDEFLGWAGLVPVARLGQRLTQLLRRSGLTHSEVPEVAGQLMRKRFGVVQASLPLVAVVPLLHQLQASEIPVVDAEGRLAGLITQDDVVAALVRSSAGPARR